jgi:Sec-independent protein translocase protein TatA
MRSLGQSFNEFKRGTREAELEAKNDPARKPL